MIPSVLIVQMYHWFDLSLIKAVILESHFLWDTVLLPLHRWAGLAQSRTLSAHLDLEQNRN